VIKIVRLAQVKGAMLGSMLIDGVPLFWTLEPAWKGNTPHLSCIPEGQYQMRREQSAKYGELYEVLNVPGRDGILCAHVGNTAVDTEGCIVIGRMVGSLEKEPAVLRSKEAVELFRQMLRPTELLLVTRA